MGRDYRDDSFPKVVIDAKMDYASIVIQQGIEQKSYLKDGIVFSENAQGQIIEIQILNLSTLKPQNTSLFPPAEDPQGHANTIDR